MWKAIAEASMRHPEQRMHRRRATRSHLGSVDAKQSAPSSGLDPEWLLRGPRSDFGQRIHMKATTMAWIRGVAR